MAQTAAHLVDHVIPHVPVRQWVLSLPIPLRLLLAAQPKLVTPVLQVVHRVITRHLLGQAGLKAGEADSGAVTLIQRFGSAANLNIHMHCLVLDGVYRCGTDGEPEFVEVPAPTDGPHAQTAAGGSLHLSHRLRPARRTEGADTAGRHAQGYGLQAEPVRRHAGFQPARRRCAAAPTSARRENHGLAEPDRQQRDPALAIGRQIQGNADAPDQGQQHQTGRPKRLRTAQSDDGGPHQRGAGQSGHDPRSAQREPERHRDRLDCQRETEIERADRRRGLEHGRRESCRIIGRPARYPARPEAP